MKPTSNRECDGVEVSHMFPKGCDGIEVSHHNPRDINFSQTLEFLPQMSLKFNVSSIVVVKIQAPCEWGDNQMQSSSGLYNRVTLPMLLIHITIIPPESPSAAMAAQFQVFENLEQKLLTLEASTLDSTKRIMEGLCSRIISPIQLIISIPKTPLQF